MNEFVFPGILIAILAFVMPGVVHFVMVKVSAAWREVIVLAVCGLIAVLAMVMTHQPLVFWPPNILIPTLCVIYTIGNLAYKKFWQPYVLGKNPEQATSPPSGP